MKQFILGMQDAWREFREAALIPYRLFQIGRKMWRNARAASNGGESR